MLLKRTLAFKETPVNIQMDGQIDRQRDRWADTKRELYSCTPATKNTLRVLSLNKTVAMANYKYLSSISILLFPEIPMDRWMGRQRVDGRRQKGNCIVALLQLKLH